jgi:geranylgeranyl reductase family protein
VIVAGAGPAGSTTARLLAGEGARVLLLDKQGFPRDKPCGGGVTLRAAQVQEVDLSPVIEQTIYGARFSLRLGESFDRRFREPLTYMTQRRRLDAYLAQRAAEAGAEFRDGEGIREIETPDRARHPEPPNHYQPPPGMPSANLRRNIPPSASPLRPELPVIVRTSSDTYTARVLIGADGANGIVGRTVGLRREYEEAVALEGNAEYPGGIPQEWQEYVGLDLGGLAGGYGWVFPKGDHLNLGVGAWKYAGFTLRPKLAELCRRYGFEARALTKLRGHHLPVRVPGSRIARGNVVVAGDAAGLVDPLSGEGIHTAFESGRLAAKQAMRVLSGEANDMSGYERAVDRRLQPELTVSRKLQELFNFAPPPYLALMRRSDKFWLYFAHLIRGELTYLDFIRMIGPLRIAVDAFAAIAERRRLGRVVALSPLVRGG